MASFDLDGTIGAYELGTLVSYILFGVTTTQVYIYYSRFPNDPRGLRYMVAFIWSCEMVHVVLVGCTLYQITVADYGHPERLILTPRPLAMAVMISAFVGTVVQVFFAFRIYRLSKSLYIPWLSWILSFSLLLGAIAVCFYGLRIETIPEFEGQFAWLLNSLWTGGAVNDLLIAGTLVYWLKKAENLSANRPSC
ncbi:hypothetical protein MVEN_00757900 [Mycena venus]|uniref:Uncharacterized protein n=1 Tax=Mycena venus TaxID=2733690 RepID=A0A8H6YFL8_9AGAR|nr:hypothetical protein MVEN_00757900 [Mycena venus]